MADDKAWISWLAESVENPEVKFITLERADDQFLMRRFTKVPKLVFPEKNDERPD